MKHTWYVIDEGGEYVEVTLDCKFSEVIAVPLSPQYLIDLMSNAKEARRSEPKFWTDYSSNEKVVAG